MGSSSFNHVSENLLYMWDLGVESLFEGESDLQTLNANNHNIYTQTGSLCLAPNPCFLHCSCSSFAGAGHYGRNQVSKKFIVKPGLCDLSCLLLSSLLLSGISFLPSLPVIFSSLSSFPLSYPPLSFFSSLFFFCYCDKENL